jgi:hypothetical protein
MQSDNRYGEYALCVGKDDNAEWVMQKAITCRGQPGTAS